MVIDRFCLKMFLIIIIFNLNRALNIHGFDLSFISLLDSCLTGICLLIMLDIL